jgi:hypothetical protein
MKLPLCARAPDRIVMLMTTSTAYVAAPLVRRCATGGAQDADKVTDGVGRLTLRDNNSRRLPGFLPRTRTDRLWTADATTHLAHLGPLSTVLTMDYPVQRRASP